MPRGAVAVAVAWGGNFAVGRRVCRGLLSGRQKAPPPVEYKPVNVEAVQHQTIAGNLANFGDASLLASKTNTFQQSEAQRLLEQAIPGYGKLQARLLQQVNSDLDSQTS